MQNRLQQCGHLKPLAVRSRSTTINRTTSMIFSWAVAIEQPVRFYSDRQFSLKDPCKQRFSPLSISPAKERD
jgi:hypothetical protein